MINNIVVGKSKIHNKGVFAKRNFKKDDVILKWQPKILEESEVEKLPIRGKPYLYITEKGIYYLMQPPERYVNHSCEPNTEVKDDCDIAVRDIKKGEEITSDYSRGGSTVSFACKCGSIECKVSINHK